jgi:beta-glucosidase
MRIRKGYIYLLFSFGVFGFVSAQDVKSLPMWNPTLSFEERVNDLVSRLTLEEKVAQMLNTAPAIPRLAIPAYDWWNEVLHGVARSPFKTTVFPQAIAMAATWDTLSLRQMARFAAYEGRAIYNKALQLQRNAERYVGLTYWTPNINIFRDPRWGRGQETYGEDPFLTAKMGAAFVRGLQGDDNKYLLAAACAKHFAVHSGPEISRHSDNYEANDFDLWDTYLPAFKELVVNARVAGVMCAYNAFRKQPCCSNDLLLTDILRNQWKFTGYVTSDCWALDDLYKYHKTQPNATFAAADALIHGTDLECGNYVYVKLVEAVKTNQIPISMIDASIKRLFIIRYRLGMFDPPSIVPYAQIPASVLETDEHKKHALSMARSSIVLLKNTGNTLPLNKKIKTIAVIGPNADNRIAVLGNYNGIPSKISTVLDGLKEKLGSNTKILYEQAVNFTNDSLFIGDNHSGIYQYNDMPGIKSEYFNNISLSGTPIYQSIIQQLHFIWPEGDRPFTEVNPFRFSARYTTYVSSDTSIQYTWQLEADEGYKMYLNDSLVLDAWGRNRWGVKYYTLKLEPGKKYKLVIEYWQNEGNAHIRLQTGKFKRTNFDSLAARLTNVDAILFVGGISPQLEGEQMPVKVPGFIGGDRSSILLPAIQTQCLKKLHTLGKPLILLMMTGSAIATPWESDHLTAIVNAWYGGQCAGTAIADVLFGDYNPAGRLPVTFYKSDTDLKSFKDYSMEGRTYRYFRGVPLYPFGYGLSYTSFRYSNIKIPVQSYKGDSIRVSVNVSNVGTRDGEEVIQLYVKYSLQDIRTPNHALKGFKRIQLKKGESRMIYFSLSPNDLSLVNDKGNSFQPSGKLIISIGGGQPGVKMPGVADVLSSAIEIINR